MGEWRKVKSVSKLVLGRGDGGLLQKIVLSTMAKAADVVGATLGPGGCPVLIERQDDLPPMVTKDGVTVFRSLGFPGSADQVVMEAARDAAVRTAQGAGDGTTTATILAEAFVRLGDAFGHKYPKISPQRVVRILQQQVRDICLPAVAAVTKTKPAREDLLAVARTSANGDQPLAEAVLQCFDLVGDEGNVTIAEESGDGAYQVSKVEGFPIATGYDESCGKFYAKFQNDKVNQRVVLDKPGFIVYHGQINSSGALFKLLGDIGEQLEKDQSFPQNIVVVATRFSESVLGALAHNFINPTTLNVYPLVAPMSIAQNGQLNFLEDVAAITGAILLDPISKPLEQVGVDVLGFGEDLTQFEATRYRSTIMGRTDADLVLERADMLQTAAKNPGSLWDEQDLRERAARLVGGIARLTVTGASSGETKERRDRAEDAVCAVRGAVQHGVLPGGGYGLAAAVHALEAEVAGRYAKDSTGDFGPAAEDLVKAEILAPALCTPIHRLLVNAGLIEEEISQIVQSLEAAVTNSDGTIYDAYNQQPVNAYEVGILDSAPAVTEALKNSLSIASLLGTLGGCVVFLRDENLERSESADIQQFLRDTNAAQRDAERVRY